MGEISHLVICVHHLLTALYFDIILFVYTISIEIIRFPLVDLAEATLAQVSLHDPHLLHISIMISEY